MGIRRGGGSGCTLTVTGVANDTATLTKGSKTYTKTFDSSGKAVFKGLSGGTWTAGMSNGTESTSRNVNIVADYAVTLAYFSATIAVTWPEGSTCTCANGSTVLTAPDTSGSYTFIVTNTGTWTVNCTDGTKTASKTVTISADGEAVSVGLAYELLLFFDGNAYTDVTGGWKGSTVTGTVNCTIEGAYLLMYAGYGSEGFCTTGNLIDLTNFNVLEVTIAESGAVTDNRSYVRVLDPTDQSLAQKNALTKGVHIVDLSEITGDCRIRFGVSGNLTYKISKVRLY
nr:MAG TPA: hypothetical protein [Caudoviricetes sp.]